MQHLAFSFFLILIFGPWALAQDVSDDTQAETKSPHLFLEGEDFTLQGENNKRYQKFVVHNLKYHFRLVVVRTTTIGQKPALSAVICLGEDAIKMSGRPYKNSGFEFKGLRHREFDATLANNTLEYLWWEACLPDSSRAIGWFLHDKPNKNKSLYDGVVFQSALKSIYGEASGLSQELLKREGESYATDICGNISNDLVSIATLMRDIEDAAAQKKEK